jgi:serine/threonine-protein kinase HipA
MVREVRVFLYGKYAGLLTQRESGFVFEYDSGYRGHPLSMSLPVSKKKFESDELHPFFKSLAPEGWLLKQYSELQRVDETDLLSILIKNGKDLIGAVTLEAHNNEMLK